MSSPVTASRVLGFKTDESLQDSAALFACTGAGLRFPHPDPLPAGEGSQRSRR